MLQTQTSVVASVASSQNTVAACATCPHNVSQPTEVVLNRVNLKNFLVEQDGKFVSIDYRKNDGSLRTLTGRLGVKAYLRGGSNTVMAADRPYLTMFDLQLLEYRTVNLATVSKIRANRKVYRVVD